ncbi:YbjN domain-containing protein [Hugenholtzia roseola]|uniref:YbjN domain-containing protein n=1 Tax=Hugenholtzia roseola TaxID=1002 RepID=UPI0003FEF3DC|nr:YbjN domain-containing protein [Hugenholtzia roseola]
MKDHFQIVRDYLLELGYDITAEDAEEQLFIINDEDEGIRNMVIDCEDPILIIEQFILDLKNVEGNVLRELLKKNREVVHGAFCLDDSGNRLLFRDTLQIENLDLNELEASINSLKLLMAEYSTQLIAFNNLSVMA